MDCVSLFLFYAGLVARELGWHVGWVNAIC